MLQNFLSWVFVNYVEIIGTIFGLLYIYLSIKQNIWCWPVGFITSALYIYVFFNTKFYADMGLQIYYLIASIYGWYFWMFGSNKNKQDSLNVSRLSKKIMIILLLITLALFIIISLILIKFTDSELPYWDAFTTAASFVATWMLARKLIENWILWIIVDIISVGLYIYKELYPTVLLFLVYTTMAYLGFVEWKKEIKNI